MYNPNAQVKFLLGAILFFIVSVVGFYILYRQIGVNQTKRDELVGQWMAEERKREQMKELDVNVNNLGIKKDLLNSHFAIGSDIAPFLDSLEKSASSLGVEAEVISVNENQDKTGLLVGLRTAGSFEEIYKFIMLLENFSYEIDFSLINIDKRTSEKKDGTATSWEALFRFQLLSFISDEAETITNETTD